MQHSGKTWFVNPWFDLLFVANVTWPAIVLLSLWAGLDDHDGVKFWQIYFVTTPHRWITLALVFLDRERFRERKRTYVGAAVVAVLFCLTVRMSTGALTCLLTIDYIWNAWHFAAQHHGIYRIYGRLSQPDRSAGVLVEKFAMRAFLVYVAVRVAGWSWSLTQVDAYLHRCDWAMIAVPVFLAARGIGVPFRQSLGRIAYLASVSSIYLGMLGAVHFQRPGLLLILATASALFHATEYLAVVSWAVQRKHERSGIQGPLGQLVPRWGLALAMFATILGLSGWMLEQHLMQYWLLLNTIVAYLHYTYDAMIWKVRQPGSYAN